MKLNCTCISVSILYNNVALATYHMPRSDKSELISSKTFNEYFVYFRFTSLEYKSGYLDNPVAKSAIFCFRDVKG